MQKQNFSIYYLKAAEPNKESGANPEQGRCRILSAMSVFGHSLSIHDVKSVTEGVFPWEGVCEPFSADNKSEYLPVFFPCQGVVL